MKILIFSFLFLGSLNYKGFSQTILNNYQWNVPVDTAVGPYNYESSCTNLIDSFHVDLTGLNDTNYIIGVEVFMEITSITDTIWYKDSLLQIGDTMHGNFHKFYMHKGSNFSWNIVLKGTPTNYCQRYSIYLENGTTLGGCGDGMSFGQGYIPNSNSFLINFETALNAFVNETKQIGDDSLNTIDYFETVCSSIQIGDSSLNKAFMFWNNGHTDDVLTVDSSGTYRFVYRDNSNCYFFNTYYVQVKDESFFEINFNECDSVFYEGQIYYNDTSLTDTLISANSSGCDSIITSNIIVNKSSSFIIDTTILSNQIFEFNNQQFDSAGTYLLTLINSQGCDSIIALNLDVLNGLEEKETTFLVSPNPSTKLFNFNSDHLIESVIIFNSLGVIILSTNPNNKTVVIDLSSYDKGVYFAKINNQKIVKLLKN